MSKHPLAALFLLALTGPAAAQLPSATNFIINQNNVNQSPGRFRIAHDLNNGEIQGALTFTHVGDLTSAYGLVARGEEMTNRGASIPVQGLAEMDCFPGQAGQVDGRLGFISGYFAASSQYGVYGVATPVSLINFDLTRTSKALGGLFTGGPDPADASLILDGVGSYFVGGIQGTLRGTIDGDAGGGAAAGVIGVDSADPNSTTPTFAGWFKGDLAVRDQADVPVFDVHAGTRQVVVGNGPAQPGYELSIHGDVWSSTGVYDASSRRWKSDIQEIGGALDLVMEMRGVRYTHDASHETHVGVIAEELGRVLPEVVGYDDQGQALGVQYGRLTAVLIEAVQEQQQQIDALRDELASLRSGR